MTNHFRFARVLTGLLSLVVIVFVLSPTALAQRAGYDLFQTASGAFVDLSASGQGLVALKGVPIESCTGNTDTIMQRTQDVPAGGGTVNVVVFALLMKSQNSITYNGQSADVYVTINNSQGAISTSVLPQPDALSGSGGTVTVRPDGTFDSNVTVNADLIFVRAGTSVTNSANYIDHRPAPPQTLNSTNASWTATAPPNFPNCAAFPANGFFPKPNHVGGPHPVASSTTTTTCTGTATATVSPQAGVKNNSKIKGAPNQNVVMPVPICTQVQ